MEELFFSSDCQPEWKPENRPLVLRGYGNSWPASSKWTFKYFIENFSNASVDVADTPEKKLINRFGERLPRRKMQLNEYLAYCEKTFVQNTDYLYLSKCDLLNRAPDLFKDFSLPMVDLGKFHQSHFIWFAPGGAVTPLHFDIPSNYFAQVFGRKRFILFPPNKGSYYKNPWHTDIFHVSKVDPRLQDLKRFPRFPWDSRIEITLDQGDMLYLPSGWWHFVESLEPNISVNTWWQTYRSSMRKDIVFFAWARRVYQQVSRAVYEFGAKTPLKRGSYD